MSNKAIRHHHAARLAPKQAPQTHEYEIFDNNHTDLRGEFGGAKKYNRGGKLFVRLNDAQAKFFLDSGSIQKVEHHRPQQEQAPAPEPDAPTE